MDLDGFKYFKYVPQGLLYYFSKKKKKLSSVALQLTGTMHVSRA